MAKKFNITGNCHANMHYMADISKKLKRTFAMVESGDYFIINRPRQYGKTTTLFAIEERAMQEKDYVVFNITFEGLNEKNFEDADTFRNFFLDLLKTINKQTRQVENIILESAYQEVSLSNAIQIICEKIDKKVILIIDEVDKSTNNQLFLSFLGTLRALYLNRIRSHTFHSVILAGVHDVKSLKLKLRPDEEEKLNSPWNIAADYKVDMNLQIDEIKPMLADYCQERGVIMNIDEIAERLFYYTSGYPFLVSKLCKMIDEHILPERENQEWTADDVELAVKELVKESNANFDTLVKNLENNKELYELVYKIVVENEKMLFNIHNPTTNFASIYGILVSKNGSAVVHNRIYQEVIVNYMTDKMHQFQISKGANFGTGYKNADKTLNMEAVMLGFQAFMKKEYSKKDRKFLEKNGRLVFLAFIKPIINGSGYDFKEPQISDEKRLDVVITYLHQKFVAELKLWYGPKAHEEGLEQLCDYLDRQNLDTGYLLIFDHSEIKKWHSEWIETAGKKIFIAWV